MAGSRATSIAPSSEARPLSSTTPAFASTSRMRAVPTPLASTDNVARGDPSVPLASRRRSTAPWICWLRQRSRCRRSAIRARSAPCSCTSARKGVVGGRVDSPCTGASASKRSSGPPPRACTKPCARSRPPCRWARACASMGMSAVFRTPPPRRSASRSSSGRDLGPSTTRFPFSTPWGPRSGGKAKAGRRARSKSFTTAAASIRVGVSCAERRSDPWSPTRSMGSTMVAPSRKWIRVS